MMDAGVMPRPAEICGRLLAALDASEGRRRRRKRNTTPDSIGLAIKQRLLEEAVREDPEPEAFEGWLVKHSELDEAGPSGPARAMALEIMADWRLAQTSAEFRRWLEQGAPSDDAAGRGNAGRLNHAVILSEAKEPKDGDR